MFDETLIESAGARRQKGSWLTTVISTGVHILLFGAVILAGYYVKENPEVIEKPIEAFMVAAAPPPPPPPPPPAASSASTPTRPRVEPTPTTPRETFTAPTETPQDIPEVDAPASTEVNDAGVVGGQEGGVVGGVVGGVAGGVVGGTLGGQLGGVLGGTGDRPLRVGGDVKPPVAITKVEPEYTEIARKARIQGIVILEAIIDTQGNVTDVRVLKPLPMGLEAAAMDAVKRWKFKPGTLGDRPVPVIFNLTINFRLQ
jgi:periplasmic protein TonB